MKKQTRFLYNPENDQVFNATELMIKGMNKLKLIDCPEAVLRLKRPDLFDTSAPTDPVAPKAPTLPSVSGGDSDEFLSAKAGTKVNEATGVTLDPNELTLLVEAIGTLDPATDFTVGGVPVPAKLSKAVGHAVSAAERDFAFAEYQRQQEQG